MKYRLKQKTLNRLGELLTLIRIKEVEVKTALAYNRKFDWLDSIDVPGLQAERETIIKEYNFLKRNL